MSFQAALPLPAGRARLSRRGGAGRGVLDRLRDEQRARLRRDAARDARARALRAPRTRRVHDPLGRPAFAPAARPALRGRSRAPRSRSRVSTSRSSTGFRPSSAWCGLPPGFPGAVGVGAAAAPTVERAWWKALAEAFACRSAGAKLALLPAREESGLQARVATFEDHILRYADHGNAAATAFLDASPARVAAGAVPPLEGSRRRGLVPGALRPGRGRGLVGLRGRRHLARRRRARSHRHPGDHARALPARRLARRTVPRRLAALRSSREARAATGVLAEDGVNPDPHPFP